MPAPLLAEIVPDFVADTTVGKIRLHDYIDGSWAILFSHPAGSAAFVAVAVMMKHTWPRSVYIGRCSDASSLTRSITQCQFTDYTPVCTTELGAVGKLKAEFDKRGVKVLALSCNDVDSHKGYVCSMCGGPRACVCRCSRPPCIRWIKDIEAYTPGSTVFYPIIADPARDIAVKYGMLDPDERDKAGVPLTARAVFIIGPDKRLKLSILYPATTGRNFDEVLRVIDSLQLTANHLVATPVDWQHGGNCMVVPTLSDEDAHAKVCDKGMLHNGRRVCCHSPAQQFPKGFEKASLPSGKGYVRVTPQPNL